MYTGAQICTVVSLSLTEKLKRPLKYITHPSTTTHRSGLCYHLYTKNMLASLKKVKPAKLECVPLYELCLQVKLLCPPPPADNSNSSDCSIVDYLMDAPTKPPLANIMHAIDSLKVCASVARLLVVYSVLSFLIFLTLCILKDVCHVV